MSHVVGRSKQHQGWGFRVQGSLKGILDIRPEASLRLTIRRTDRANQNKSAGQEETNNKSAENWMRSRKTHEMGLRVFVITRAVSHSFVQIASACVGKGPNSQTWSYA